jgi:plastocyanin
MTKQLAMMALAIGFVAGCGGGGGGGGGGGPTDPPPPAPNAVTVTTPGAPPPRFIPAAVAVAVGGTVTWQSGSPVNHNVISTTGAFEPVADLAPGASAQRTFTQRGTFAYRCSIHEGMNGTIEVR